MKRRISLVAAFVLAVCFVLPLSTCTRYVDEKGEAVEVEDGESRRRARSRSRTARSPAEQLWTNPLGGVTC